MALAFVLLILDVKLTTHGVLTVGAIASLIFGALIFFNSGGPHQGTPGNIPLGFGMAGVFFFCFRPLLSARAVACRARRAPADAPPQVARAPLPRPRLG